jgi:diguanylate cyclase (GGDEF)-like protein
MPLRPIRCLLRWALALGLALAVIAAHAAPALRLDDRQAEQDVWPALGMLVDAGRTLGLDQVRQRMADFRPPDGPASSLGARREAIWLHLPLQVAGGDGQWVLDIDYPVLGRAEVYLVSDGRLVLQRLLGSTQPFAERPMPSRTHALALQLPPGHAHELYLRVLSQSAMVLPITLSKPDAFHARESRRMLAQGLMNGVALALLAYSLAHWLSLRNALFGLYALMLAGTGSFFFDFVGLAQQYLWGERNGLAALVSPLSVLLALAAGSQFVARSLDTRRHSPRLHRGLLLLTWASLASFVVALSGWVDYPLVQAVTIGLGPLMPLLAIPAAWGRARQGDRAAVSMLIGWGAYLVGAIAMAGLLRGLLPATFLTRNLFQWASLVEMLVWLRVLGLHIEGVRRAAEHTELEKQAALLMAHTDPLTGLPNRRGLSRALEQALLQCRPDDALVVYLLDLDGFKPVNDRLGHDAGDELLVQVGQRLKAQLRHGDVVARLGGDEFVIMTAGMTGEAEALGLGRKLLDAFLLPFEVAGQSCRVGITIGFALAPHDGREAGDLLKRADAAMYIGKQSGRHTVRRGGASGGLAGSALS